MNTITSSGIIILIMLILVFLQFVPSIFLLFQHYSYGKLSHKKAKEFGLFFIFGTYLATVLFYSLTSFIVDSLLSIKSIDYRVYLWISSGLFFAIGLIILFLYFKKGDGTKLFVPRKITQKYIFNLTHIKAHSEALLLGATSIIPELIFTLPLFFYANIELNYLNNNLPFELFFTLLTVFSMLIPLIFIYSAFVHHHNMATIQRFRVKNKHFIRLFLSSMYFILTLIIIVFRIMA